ERFGDAIEGNALRLHAAVDDCTGAWGAKRGVDRQAENGAGAEGEFALHLRDERAEAGVVRTWRDFAEPDIVAFDEELDAEDAIAAKRFGDFAGDVARAGESFRAHRLRLPAFDIVAIDLDVADGFAEVRAAGGADSEQGNFEIEHHLPFHDHAWLLHTAGAHGVVPRWRDIGL